MTADVTMLKLAQNANCNVVDEVVRTTINGQPCYATTTMTTTTTTVATAMIIVERFIAVVNDSVMIQQQAISALHNRTQRPGFCTQTYIRAQHKARDIRLKAAYGRNREMYNVCHNN